jgi:hypothetical protein
VNLVRCDVSALTSRLGWILNRPLEARRIELALFLYCKLHDRLSRLETLSVVTHVIPARHQLNNCRSLVLQISERSDAVLIYLQPGLTPN